MVNDESLRTRSPPPTAAMAPPDEAAWRLMNVDPVTVRSPPSMNTPAPFSAETYGPLYLMSTPSRTRSAPFERMKPPFYAAPTSPSMSERFSRTVYEASDDVR